VTLILILILITNNVTVCERRARSMFIYVHIQNKQPDDNTTHLNGNVCSHIKVLCYSNNEIILCCVRLSASGMGMLGHHNHQAKRASRSELIT
jgi:hypothetical protein